MRILVCGSRHWKDYQLVRQTLPELRQLDREIVIICGGAPGPDTWAYELAPKLGYDRERYRPKYWLYPEGRKREAPLDRNTEMLDSGIDLVLAFRAEGKSNGTDDTINKARFRGVPVRVVRETGDGPRDPAYLL